MKAFRTRAAALAGLALTAAVIVGVDAAPASAHVTASCAASTTAFIDTTPAQDLVGIKSTKCVHRSTITCRNSAGALWTFTDAPATRSDAYNLNVCRSANPVLVAVEFHSY